MDQYVEMLEHMDCQKLIEEFTIEGEERLRSDL
jgi:hypothetical protein